MYTIQKKISQLSKDLSQNESISSLSCKTELLRSLIEYSLETILAIEIDTFLGSQEKQQRLENRIIGYEFNNPQTKYGKICLVIPKDFHNKFRPVITPQDHNLSDNIEEWIIGLYANGLRPDLPSYIAQKYKAKISNPSMRTVSLRINAAIKKWLLKPLRPVYMIIFIDVINCYVKNGDNYNFEKVHIVTGIDLDGNREILTILSGTPEKREYWGNMVARLKKRGVKKIILACINENEGFQSSANITNSIRSVFPNTKFQLSILKDIKSFLNNNTTSKKSGIYFLAFFKNFIGRGVFEI